ncbi:MAG: 50S ribosomal protein L21 [Firmicutes bacterium]|jgi:large subunit ribosomal protein L21|nr:50S ribosomal protein L21 [Bacillota bacterium]HXL05009.1 50S ribosomal protein L21 [Bacillota bacterium]
MYAIIETGGKQYRVKEGDVLRVEKLPSEPGETVEFEKVLLVHDGDAVKVGNPMLSDVRVSAKVLAQGKSRKILVFKYKPKKNYRKRYGHRQPYTEIQIERIEV